jgi:hypothetical protein
MAGLLLLFVASAWLLTCISLTKGAVKTLRPGLAKALLALGAFVGLLVAPVADDILGSMQFNRYCAAADKIRLLGTVSVASNVGLYSESGDWLLATLEPSQHAERIRLVQLADSLVFWDHGTSAPSASLFPIEERTTRIYDTSPLRLVAEWKSYYYRGGFLRSGLLDSANQCFPTLSGSGLYPKLFVLQR